MKESDLAFSPFVRTLTFAVLKSIKTKKIIQERKHVIDTDLVPKVSQRVFEASLSKSFPQRTILEPPRFVERPQPKMVPIKEQKPKPIKKAPIVEQKIASPIVPKKKVMAKPAPMPTPVTPSSPQVQNTIAPPSAPASAPQTPTEDYGKIQPILLDPSVSTIECPGPGKQISVVRKGQKEFTNIILTPTEIKEIIEKVAETAHIPVMEGIFRAAVDNFSINAVVSEMIGSRFTIKKQTPYSMLEKP